MSGVSGTLRNGRVESSLLVLRLSALGDVIHTLPAVVALRNARPELQITWVVESAYSELVERVGDVTALPVSMRRWGRNLRASSAEIAKAREALRRFEVSVDFQGLVKSASLGFLSGARLRYGFDRRAIRERAALLFTNRHIAVDRQRHVVEWNLQLAEAVAKTPLAAPSLDFSRFLDALDIGKDRIVLLPGAGRPEKQWPVENYRELSHRLGDRVLVAWGPGEEELARRIDAPIAPPTTLRELASLLSNAAVVIAGDTGPLHLAAALGTPVVGLYAPTSERRNGPYAQLQRCISRYGTSMSMESITVGEVEAMVSTVLR